MRKGKQLKYYFLILLVSFNFAWFGSQLITENIRNINNLSTNDDFYYDSDTFIHIINGKKYLAEILTEEDIGEMKNQLNNNQNSQCIMPNEEEMDHLVGKVNILSVYDGLASEINLKTAGTINDLSNETYFPVVGNQLTQGSCASWSVVYYSMGYIEARDMSWDASSGNQSCLLSPGWVYNKITNNDTGSSLIANGIILQEIGAATMAAMPYNDSDSDDWGNSTAWNEAPYHRALSYNRIEFDNDTIINTIKSLIDGKTPVSFCLNSSEIQLGGSAFSDSNYVLSSLEYISNTIDHACTIVGYNDSISDDGDVGAFKVVNSWGTTFGDNGFFWITYETLKEIQGIGDILSLVDRNDYQPTLIANWTFSSSPIKMNQIITLGVGPISASYDIKTVPYMVDYNDTFPSYMALDISEFHSYYISDPNVNFYLKVDNSITAGIISSFMIKRYSDGTLVETTKESLDVPRETPGYVTNQFKYMERKVPGYDFLLLLGTTSIISALYLHIRSKKSKII